MVDGSENEIPRRGEFHSLTCMRTENRVERAGPSRLRMHYRHREFARGINCGPQLIKRGIN